MAKYYGKKDKKESKGIQKGRAGLPSEVVMKEYPKGSYGAKEGYVDTQEGIDMFAKENSKRL